MGECTCVYTCLCTGNVFNILSEHQNTHKYTSKQEKILNNDILSSISIVCSKINSEIKEY